MRQSTAGTRTFHDILLEKLDVSDVGVATEVPHVSPETHSNTLAFESFFTSLHNTVDAFVADALPGISLMKTPYAQAKATHDVGTKAKSSASTATKSERPARPERTKIRSQLSTVETAALATFVKLGAGELSKSDLIGETIVKKAYRRLAVTLHPDVNTSRSTEQFRALSEAYVILAKMFRA